MWGHNSWAKISTNFAELAVNIFYTVPADITIARV